MDAIWQVQKAMYQSIDLLKTLCERNSMVR